jgi:uncharacterized protein (DUF433 family)
MTSDALHFYDRVIVDPSIMVGKPVIRGTRIPVSVILNLLAHSYDHARVPEAYPDLVDEDISAVLAYSAARLDREEVRSFEAAG